MKRILIVKLGSIGDVVHTLSALADIRASFPLAQVDWLVERKAGVVLRNHPWLSQVIEVDTQRWRRSFWQAGTYRDIRHCLRRLRSRCYDVAFDFQGLWKSAVFGFCSGARLVVGFEKAYLREPSCRILYGNRVLPDPGTRHVIDLYRTLVASQGAVRSRDAFQWGPGEGDRSYVDERLAEHDLEEFIILNPGGGWVTKNWSPVNYGLLHDRIREQLGLRTVLTWGPGEEDLVRRVVAACRGEPPLTFPTTLPQFIALARRARLFVGGDTGPLHLAAACKTPVVGIYGPTDPARNGPYDPADRVVSHPVPCGPCYKRTCWKYRARCMTLVTVDQVFDAVSRRLESQRSDAPPFTPA